MRDLFYQSLGMPSPGGGGLLDLISGSPTPTPTPTPHPFIPNGNMPPDPFDNGLTRQDPNYGAGLLELVREFLGPDAEAAIGEPMPMPMTSRGDPVMATPEARPSFEPETAALPVSPAERSNVRTAPEAPRTLPRNTPSAVQRDPVEEALEAIERGGPGGGSFGPLNPGGGTLLPAMDHETALAFGRESEPGGENPNPIAAGLKDFMRVVGGALKLGMMPLELARNTIQDVTGHPASMQRAMIDQAYPMAEVMAQQYMPNDLYRMQFGRDKPGTEAANARHQTGSAGTGGIEGNATGSGGSFLAGAADWLDELTRNETREKASRMMGVENHMRMLDRQTRMENQALQRLGTEVGLMDKVQGLLRAPEEWRMKVEDHESRIDYRNRRAAAGFGGGLGGRTEGERALAAGFITPEEYKARLVGGGDNVGQIADDFRADSQAAQSVYAKFLKGTYDEATTEGFLAPYGYSLGEQPNDGMLFGFGQSPRPLVPLAGGRAKAEPTVAKPVGPGSEAPQGAKSEAEWRAEMIQKGFSGADIEDTLLELRQNGLVR